MTEGEVKVLRAVHNDRFAFCRSHAKDDLTRHWECNIIAIECEFRVRLERQYPPYPQACPGAIR